MPLAEQEEPWQTTPGVVVKGYQVASQPSQFYPAGTIAMQLPVFKVLGLDLSAYFAGTLNVSIAPRTVEIVRPAHTFRGVRWTRDHPPEDFQFFRCRCRFDGLTHTGLIYRPDPATKLRHFQEATTLELILPAIERIRYGDRVEVGFPASELILK